MNEVRSGAMASDPTLADTLAALDRQAQRYRRLALYLYRRGGQDGRALYLLNRADDGWHSIKALKAAARLAAREARP